MYRQLSSPVTPLAPLRWMNSDLAARVARHGQWAAPRIIHRLTSQRGFPKSTGGRTTAAVIPSRADATPARARVQAPPVDPKPHRRPTNPRFDSPIPAVRTQFPDSRFSGATVSLRLATLRYCQVTHRAGQRLASCYCRGSTVAPPAGSTGAIVSAPVPSISVPSRLTFSLNGKPLTESLGNHNHRFRAEAE